MNNMLSLLLGLLSWGLGVAAVRFRGSRWLSPASIFACSLSLMLQLRQVHCLVQIGDWSALMDTMDAVMLAGTVLLLVTAALNLTAFLKR